MGLLFSEKTQIIRAFKAASESVKADADGTAPFETEAERKATKKLMEDTRAALITMGFVPEAVLAGVIEQKSGSLQAGAARAGWGENDYTGGCLTDKGLFMCSAIQPSSLYDQEISRRDVCAMSYPASHSTQPRKISDEKDQENALRELLKLTTNVDPTVSLSQSISKKIQDLIDIVHATNVDVETRKKALDQLSILGVGKKG